MSPQEARAFFQLGDILTVTNPDRPAWAEGRWRVFSVEFPYVQLMPLMSDDTVDDARVADYEYYLDVVRGRTAVKRGKPCRVVKI